jgi:DNA-binding NtrC family response regulator
MSFSIVVYSHDTSFKTDLKKFFEDREERISYENNSIRVILRLIKEEAHALFLDMNNNLRDYFKIIDILKRIYFRLPVVAFNASDSIEKLIKLKKYGVFYSTMKPVHFSILREITDSIKLIKFEKIFVRGGYMKTLNIALVLSSNNKLRENFSHLFNQMGVSYIFESKELNGLLRIMSIPLKAVFIEINPYDKSGLDFIKLIKNLNPQLKIIAVSSYSCDNDLIIEAGADHCIERSVIETEMDSIIEKFNALMQENHLEKKEIK